MRKQISFLSLIFLSLVLLSASSCGGGGGAGNDFFVAATIDIDAYPESIYVGERTIITTYIDDVCANGVVVKFRYPQSLHYVPETAFLDIDGQIVDIGPLFNGLSRKDYYNYLVFVFPQETFGKHRNGKLFFHLEAAKMNNAARVAVAATMRDTNLPDTQQFNINDPKFGSDTEVTIRIKS